MCDYSLYAIPNRLAEDGERVALYRFGTGTIGFASCGDVQSNQTRQRGWKKFCSEMKALLLPRRCPGVPAVCMPPGTRLLMSNIPVEIQRVHGMHSGDAVVATEISSRSYSYRDALILPNGKCVLLQELPEGLEALVLSTALEVVENAEPVEVFVR
ncbi:MAG TPA: hypothetical protein VFA65_19225 [Bryobacteraceae bacterium]|nr:hypothetical protein [Bryobacteraceae bacterium]